MLKFENHWSESYFNRSLLPSVNLERSLPHLVVEGNRSCGVVGKKVDGRAE
jgi:hypothetical protein